MHMVSLSSQVCSQQQSRQKSQQHYCGIPGDFLLMRWRLVIGCVAFITVSLQQAVGVGNPRFYWTYSDEDLVGLHLLPARS